MYEESNENQRPGLPAMVHKGFITLVVKSAGQTVLVIASTFFVAFWVQDRWQQAEASTGNIVSQALAFGFLMAAMLSFAGAGVYWFYRINKRLYFSEPMMNMTPDEVAHRRRQRDQQAAS